MDGEIRYYQLAVFFMLEAGEMVGATQMIDENGSIIARRLFDDGEGMIISEFSLDKSKRKPADIKYNKYWIEDMLDPYIYA